MVDYLSSSTEIDSINFNISADEQSEDEELKEILSDTKLIKT